MILDMKAEMANYCYSVQYAIYKHLILKGYYGEGWL